MLEACRRARSSSGQGHARGWCTIAPEPSGPAAGRTPSKPPAPFGRLPRPDEPTAVSRYWTDTVRRLSPYVPGEQRGGADVVRLNTNENPYPPSPRVLEAIAGVDGDALRRYPDSTSLKLREALARYHGLDPSQVFVGNGSDEILALAFLAFFTDGRTLRHPDPSYAFYPVYCGLYGIESRALALDDDYRIDLDALRVDEGGVVFPNPNAPSSLALSTDEVRSVLAANASSVVLVDEAYADFGAPSVVSLVAEHPNLLVSRTFSKGRSLAGLRLGVAFGDAELVEALVRVKDSFNSFPVDAIASAAGIAALDDETWHREHVARIVATRASFTAALRARDWRVLDSAANFVFARPPGGDARAIYEALGAADVLVRFWERPRLREWLRISIGTDADMARLLRVLDEGDAAHPRGGTGSPG